MRKLFKRYVSDIVYLWVAIASALVYCVSGDTAYLLAALIAPITQHFYERGNK